MNKFLYFYLAHNFNLHLEEENLTLLKELLIIFYNLNFILKFI